MKKTLPLILFSIAFALFPSRDARADIGLSTRFVDVEVENVKVGTPVRLVQLKSKRYSVRNRSSVPMHVRVQIGSPRVEDVYAGYEPIPDPSWVKVVPEEFLLQPNQRIFARIWIHVPAKAEYIGRHFQAKITATTDQSPYVVAAAVQSRLRFSTGPKPAAKEAVESMSLVLDVASQTVSAGKWFGGSGTLEAANRSGEELQVECKSVPWDPALPLDGFEPAPDAAWLQVKESPMVLPAEGSGRFGFRVKIPRGAKTDAKGYAFLIEVQPKSRPKHKTYSRVYVLK